MNEIKIKDRFGVLEIQEIDGDWYYMKCLVHTERRPIRLTTKQLKTATQCLACASTVFRKNMINLTGQIFGDYVAIKLKGLSIGAGTIRHNQKQWQGKAELDYNTYCRHKYWLCYCRHCYKERELRGDVLRSDNVPRCECQNKG